MNERVRQSYPLAGLLYVVVILCLIVIVVFVWRCTKPEVVAAPNLVIEDETIACWITLDNSFTQSEESDDCKRPFWNGLLFQLGKYFEASVEFSKVELRRANDETSVFAAGDFAWINVVSVKDVEEVEPNCPETPMDPKDALMLYPVEDPVGGAEKIHNNFLPVAIMTYWQGYDGWDCKARPEGKAPPYNEQSFWLNDKFRVEVYKAVSSGEGWSMELIDSYSDVEKITVFSDNPGPELGTKLDPPWPTGTPPGP